MIAPLLVNSAYSFHYGVLHPKDLAALAAGLGYRSLALTDRNGMFGAPVFAEACHEYGINPIHGLELQWPVGGRTIMLAIDRQGFSYLTRLLTARAEALTSPQRGNATGGTRHTPEAAEDAGAERTFAGNVPFDTAAWICNAPDGVAVACDAPEALHSCPEDAFALLTPGNRSRWRQLLATGRPPLAAGDVRLGSQEDRELQRLLVAIGSRRTVPEIADDEIAAADAIMLSPARMEMVYADVPEALANNDALTGSVRFGNLFDGFIFPEYADGTGGTAISRLTSLVYEGAARRYNVSDSASLPPAVVARIDHELEIIGSMNFADYFLVMRDIVRLASRTCGRGSAAASIVSYSLGITDVDPIRHNLYFERFLNLGRSDPPDIDVDFAWDERDAVLDATMQRFGTARAARVANHIMYQPRSAFHETARAFGLPESEIAAFTRRLATAPEATASQADDVWKTVLRLAPRLTGLPSHIGVHSGGVIMVPDKLADHVPIVSSGSGIRVTAWDKDGVEAAGLVKMDLLGNRSLAVVRDALANLKENGVLIDEDTWHPVDDPVTVSMLASGNSMGVFYIESPAMRLLQKKTGAGDFEHIVIHSSIIRPAANPYINEYIDRLHGKPYKPLHPLLADTFAESYGILCYQEDVSKAATALAGFGPVEADKIRKILSKKDAATRLGGLYEAFVRGARARGVDDATITTVWGMMESFTGYSFVKAHSASYAMLSFKSAYLRAHHPAEFMAAVISNRGGFYSTLAYVSEARRMGLRVLPPDVIVSEERCTGREQTIRFGLGMIGSLGITTVRALLDNRTQHGAWKGVEDLVYRVRIDREEAEALVGSGALDALAEGQSRPTLLMRVLKTIARREQSEASSGDLFGGYLYGAPAAEPVCEPGRGEPYKPGNQPEPYTDMGAHAIHTATSSHGQDSPRAHLAAELRFLGTTLAVHPLSLWPKALALARVRAEELEANTGRRVRLIGWPVTGKAVLAKSGNPMEFFTFEDETAGFETVLFPDVYRRFGTLLYDNRPLIVSGTVQNDRGATILEVSSLARIHG